MLQVGIVGLPNVGKSTLFNALTRAGATVASYPFTTIDPNVGVVEVPDHRLGDIAALVNPDEIKPTTIEFVDIAGLVKGAHRGEGLGNQFLGHIRNVDAVAIVVRCFKNPDIAHVTEELDPLADCDIIDLELVLADLATVERRVGKVQAAAKAHPRDYESELEFLGRMQAHLEAGCLASLLPVTESEAEFARSLQLLTAKPRLYVANAGEDCASDGSPLSKAVSERAKEHGTQSVMICAQLEADLSELAPEEAAEYRSELDLGPSGLERLVKACYELLRLVTFFTATGTKVVRAWTLEGGKTALEAAGKVHTDMQKGFIRAEVISYNELVAAGGMAMARDRGLVRIEGRDYVVHDGDVMHIRFSPAR
jgi:GTP-binding protein YchF